MERSLAEIPSRTPIGFVEAAESSEDGRSMVQLIVPAVTSHHVNMELETYHMTDKHLKEVLFDELPEDVAQAPFSLPATILMFIGLFGGLFKPPVPVDWGTWAPQIWQWIMVLVIVLSFLEKRRQYQLHSKSKPKSKDQIIKSVMRKCKG